MTEEQEKYSYDLNDNGDKVKWLAIEHGYSIERIAYSMGMSMNQVKESNENESTKYRSETQS